MSEENTEVNTTADTAAQNENSGNTGNTENQEAGSHSDSTSGNSAGQKLKGLFVFKEGMSTIFNEKGEAVPVTVLRYEPLTVTQIKTKEKDGYTAVQVGFGAKKLKSTSKSELGHVKKAGVDKGFRVVREVRQDIADVKLGSVVSIESLKTGDIVSLTGTSKGHGFTGVQKRWNFAGGPATHGSKFQRRPGSSGNRTWPGRVMPGKKFPGHYGVDTVTLRSVEVVQVIPEENVVMVKGPVPGARNSLVQLVRS